MKDQKVFQIGLYPPPYGGISTHVQRLHHHLLGKGWDSKVLDLSAVPKEGPGVVVTPPWLLLLFFFAPKAVLHLHLDGWKYLLLFKWLTKRHKVLFSIHNERFMRDLDARKGFLKDQMVAALKSFPRVIVDNEECGAFLKEKFGLTNLALVPEFIPDTRKSEMDRARLEPFRKRFRHLLGSNASKLFFYQGVDMYGVDLMIDLVGKLKDRYDLGFLFLLPQTEQEGYLKALQARIQKQGLEDRFLFFQDPLENAASLWEACDLVVRATNTDGNSMTVLEALSVGTPVVASDCVSRPEGACLFKTRDLGDLILKVSSTLDHLEKAKKDLRGIERPNNAEAIEVLYPQ